MPSRDPDEAQGQLLAAFAKLEKRFDALDDKVEALTTKENQREGSSRLWRWAGGVAAGVAISLGGSALTLARDAAVDHERVVAVQADLEEFHRSEDAEELLEAERWERMGREFGQAQSTIDTTKAVLERVERQLERLEEQRAPRR